jgi:hypothetical protein
MYYPLKVHQSANQFSLFIVLNWKSHHMGAPFHERSSYFYIYYEGVLSSFYTKIRERQALWVVEGKIGRPGIMIKYSRLYMEKIYSINKGIYL